MREREPKQWKRAKVKWTRGGEGFKWAREAAKNEKVVEKEWEWDQLNDIENYHESMVYDQTKKSIIIIEMIGYEIFRKMPKTRTIQKCLS